MGTHNISPLKFSYVLVFSVILILFFPSPAEGAIGNMQDTVRDSLEFDVADIDTPSIINVGNNIIAIAYADNVPAGQLVTVSINSSGSTISAVIDTLQFDGTAINPTIIKVSGDIYAIAYSGVGGDGFVKTVSIDSAGNIGDAVLATLEFDGADGDFPDLINVSGTIFAVAYTGVDSAVEGSGDGFVKTFSISNDGTTIGAVLATLEFDTTAGSFPRIVNVDGDVFAIAYEEDQAGDGTIQTITIDSDGTAIAAVANLVYDAAAVGASNSFINVVGDIFAVAYTGAGNDGFVQAVDISTDGATISITGLGSLEFDITNGGFPKIIRITSSVYAISYDDTGGAGNVATVNISQDGTSITAIDTLEYDAAGVESSIVQLRGNIYVIAYAGTADDGFVTTVYISTPIRTGGDGCIGTCSAPTLGIDKTGIRQVEGGFSYNGNPVDVESFYTSYPLITVKVEQKNVAVLKVFDDNGVDKIAHVALAFGLGEGETFTKSQAVISLDIDHNGTETVSVTDPNNALDNINVSTNVGLCKDDSTNECLIVKIGHTFREPLDFNMVSTYVWDQRLNSWQNYYNHGIEIFGESLNPPTVEYIEDEYGTIHVLQIEQVIDGIRLDENHKPWILVGDTWEPYIGNYSQIHPETIEEFGTPTVLNRDYDYWQLMIQGEEQFAQAKLNEMFNGESIYALDDDFIETDDRAYYRTLHRESGELWDERLQGQELLAMEKLQRMLGGELIGGYDS